jgi:hypothetical protein
VQHKLRVDTARVQAMASGWGTSIDELQALTAPAGAGLSSQPSAMAVNAAHAEVAAFTEALAARVDTRATHAAYADGRYIANETQSANELTTVVRP